MDCLTAPASQDEDAEKRLFSLQNKHLIESVRGVLNEAVSHLLYGPRQIKSFILQAFNAV